MTDPDPISPFETDLAWRIDIINQLIAEDPENTIRDYAELVDELRLIENTKKYRNERK